MKEFIENLMEGNGIKYGKPWRLSDKSLGVAIPIVSLIETVRHYRVLLDKDNIKVSDTGDIDKLKLTMNVKEPIFIRSGTIFKGDTQARGLQTSIIVMPQTNEQEIPVRCVQASKGIVMGTSMNRATVVAPQSVDKELLRGDQGAVWGSVSLYSLSAQPSRTRLLGSMGSETCDSHIASDNLTKELQDMKGSIDQIIKKMPIVKNQGGIVIVDAKGVLGIEIFDSSDSWEEMKNQIISKYGRELSEEVDSIFEINEKKIPKKISEFLNTLLACKEEISFEDKEAKTFILKGNGVIGEYSKLKEKVIHILGMRSDKE